MSTLSRSEIESQLRRWFFADAIDAATIDRIEAGYRALATDEGKRQGLLRQFDEHNPANHGLAWWETRRNVSGVDEPTLFVMSVRFVPDPPPPRLHCPDAFVGQWQLDGGTTKWTLHADGRAESVTTDPQYDRTGWRWAIHDVSVEALEMFQLMWIPPVGLPTSTVVQDVAPDHFLVYPPNAIRGTDRWNRI